MVQAHTWFVVSTTLVFAISALITVIVNTDPAQASVTQLATFYLSLFAIITMLITLLHLLIAGRQRSWWVGIRRGSLIGSFLALWLYLSQAELNNIWNTVPLLIALGLIEIYLGARTLSRV